MKPIRLPRLLWIVSFLGLLAGCPAKSAPPPVTPAPVDGAPSLTADGQRVAASTLYRGECMPAGSRGGCYEITLDPDGSYRHLLLDAEVGGTYVIAGDQVTLTPSGDMPPQTLTLSADRRKLDDFVYQPPTAP